MNKVGVVRLGALIVLTIFAAGMFQPTEVGAATLSELLAKQEQLKKQEEDNKRALEKTKRDANSLENAISNLDGDISYTSNRIGNAQNQIETTNAVLAELNKEIANNQAELDSLYAKLSSAYVNLYQLSQTSTVELLLQSSSLEDAFAQAEYIQAIQTDLQKSIAKTDGLKKELEAKKVQSESQKQSLENLKNELDRSKSSLNSQKNQKNNLLTQTEGQQAHYERLLAQIRSQSSQISSDIYRSRLEAGGFFGGGNGNYPMAGNCDQVDNWLFYTCQCTSYAAWKFLQIHGVPFSNTRPGSGSAYNWPALANDQGYQVQYGGTPRVGDIVSWNRPLFSGDQWGHVAIVEVVYSSSDIVVSEYNWSPAKKFSQRRINPSSSGAPRYIRP